MNKRYEEKRPDFFTNSGETLRRQYVWAKNEKGEEYLQEIISPLGSKFNIPLFINLVNGTFITIIYYWIWWLVSQ